MDRLSDLNFQELFVFMKLLLRDVYEWDGADCTQLV